MENCLHDGIERNPFARLLAVQAEDLPPPRQHEFVAGSSETLSEVRRLENKHLLTVWLCCHLSLLKPVSCELSQLETDFRAFIENPAFSCVGAKAALARDRMAILTARDLTSGWDDLCIYPQLFELVQRFNAAPEIFQSLVVLFEAPHDLSEEEFERHMWARLQSLADKDAWRGLEYDPEVDRDPDSPHFSFSIGGDGFFIVGLHPHASRPARRFRAPAIVFNIRKQFEMLRAEGRYEKLREKIIERDVALAGTINPMLARHGEGSEARQYSGRAVKEDWKCPFHAPHDD